MKVVSKEEEQAHFREVLRGGLIGGTTGLAFGLGGVAIASRRSATFRGLTLPFRAFLVSSATTAAAVTTAERYSVAFARAQDPMSTYRDAAQRAADDADAARSRARAALDWGREHRYQLVFGAWLSSMVAAFALVGRNRYLTGPQKLVQARMYAQFLTLAVVLASAVLETTDAQSGKGRWETVRVIDPNDPEHTHMVEQQIHREEYQGQDLWKDMVAAEERRLAQKDKAKHAVQEAVKDKPFESKAPAPAKSSP